MMEKNLQERHLPTAKVCLKTATVKMRQNRIDFHPVKPCERVKNI